MSTLTDLFTQIADAIRAKSGSTGQIQASAFPSAITNIPSTTVSIVERTFTDKPSTFTVTEFAGKNNFIGIRRTNALQITQYSGAVATGLIYVSDIHETWYITVPTSGANYTNNGSLTFDGETGTITTAIPPAGDWVLIGW